MTSNAFLRHSAPVLLAGIMLSGCGSTEAATNVPSLSGDGASDSVTTTTIDTEEAVNNFVACLREQGLDVADPQVDADGNVDVRSIFESAGVDPRSTETQDAMEPCQADLESVGFGGDRGNQEDRQEATLSFTSCLRSEGLDVGDLEVGNRGPGADGAAGDGAPADGAQPPADGQGRGGLGGPGGGNAGDRTDFLAEQLDLDPTDPAVEAAMASCVGELGEIGGPGGAPNGDATDANATEEG